MEHVFNCVGSTGDANILNVYFLERLKDDSKIIFLSALTSSNAS